MRSFTYTTRIHLRDTDATGVLYFADQFRLALEALEAFLSASGISLKKIIQEEDFLLPIVHAEGDYYAPLTVGDPLEITLRIGQIGTSSFRIDYVFVEGERKITVGKVSIVHVAISKKDKASIPIPRPLFNLLSAHSDSEAIL
jgi:1,4-dihydroxy-2-naphthoyl-CoA hydrolase